MSRGHPLILKHLGDLAAEPDALEKYLERIEGQGYRELPDLFAGPGDDREREAERRYLEDVAVNAVDLLIE